MKTTKQPLKKINNSIKCHKNMLKQLKPNLTKEQKYMINRLINSKNLLKKENLDKLFNYQKQNWNQNSIRLFQREFKLIKQYKNIHKNFLKRLISSKKLSQKESVRVTKNLNNLLRNWKILRNKLSKEK